MQCEDTGLEAVLAAENINIWSKNQSSLEQQALHEIETLDKEFKKKTHVSSILEDGEIKDYYDRRHDSTRVSLNVDLYIKEQEELKKRQDFKRILNKDFVPVNAKRKSTKIFKKKKIKKNTDVSCTTDKEKVGVDIGSDNNAWTAEVEENQSGSEYVPSDTDSDYECSEDGIEEQLNNKKRKISPKYCTKQLCDDGIWQNYKKRLDIYYEKIFQEKTLNEMEGDNEQEDIILNGGLKIPVNMWDSLYGYQQDAIKWLWKLHRKSMGGILGDEMGLGKTVQIIAFLYSLEHSKIRSCYGRFIGVGPSLIICPATVLHQWVQHFHEWAPECRVAVLHQSGSYQGNKAALIKDMHKTKGIILTTYIGVIKYQTHLLDYNWHYVILDEGHKIRNASAKTSVAIKLFRTPHRLLLTGSPLQNDLAELWSLFDFTNPGMLGDLKTFQEHFTGPILQGGFTNSTPMQEATALSVASTLKDIITPYLLRRTKQEVQHHISLPKKTEQVLFCSLSDEQKHLYKEYLLDDDVSQILGKGVKNWAADNHIRARVFVAITKLRKICNHPDIFLSESSGDENQLTATCSSGKVFGYYKKSGKMVVVSALLKIWKRQGHRVLLFTQGRSMIGIFQNFLEEQGYKYLKMDGTTSISTRQPLIEKFNSDPSYDVFLLTTRVGGLGVNLTGANRVIIYDPDWNPATDTQARERAWRIGQDKEVTIYRLLSAGTIEEKMYQRQVWKQLLSNKILIDPRTSKFFRSSDLFDLFSLQETVIDNPETVNIFHNSRVHIQNRLSDQAKNKTKKRSKAASDSSCFSEDKIQQMKNLAQHIAKSLNKKPTNLQVELDVEKKEKEIERREMATLEASELLKYNKEKLKESNELINQIDDCEAIVNFSEALEYSEKTSKIHKKLKNAKDLETIVEEARRVKQQITKKPNRLIDKFKKKKKTVDKSGKIDGERVEGLVKVELKKNKKMDKDNEKHVEQNDFILEKLLKKKGVFGAVQHDSVVQGGSRGGSLKIHSEATKRAEKSFEALKKSRVDSWRW